VDTNGSYQIGGTMLRTPIVDTPTQLLLQLLTMLEEQLHSIFNCARMYPHGGSTRMGDVPVPGMYPYMYPGCGAYG
jgi:hypothetical protein